MKSDKEIIDKLIKKLLSRDKKIILKHLKKRKTEIGIKKYRAIMKKFNKDIIDEKTFKDFYGMNGRTSPGENRGIFKLLKKKETNLKTILNEVYEKGDHKVQFSFATKVIHTIQPNAPIWDKNVRDWLELPPIWQKGKEKKIDAAYKLYGKLKVTMEVMLKDHRVKTLLKYIRQDMKIDRVVSDMKLLDFIIWSWKFKK